MIWKLVCDQKQIMLVTDYSNDTAGIGLCSKCLMKPAIFTRKHRMNYGSVRTSFTIYLKSIELDLERSGERCPAFFEMCIPF